MNTVVQTRRSGLTLVFLGLLGVAFFWMTDPHLGPPGHPVADVHQHVDWRHVLFVLRGSPENPVDAASQARTGTFIGVAGSLGVLLSGLWLSTRRRA
jgi:hypothetical protein